jgi:hypothetical protein
VGSKHVATLITNKYVVFDGYCSILVDEMGLLNPRCINYYVKCVPGILTEMVVMWLQCEANRIAPYDAGAKNAHTFKLSPCSECCMLSSG